MRPSAPWAIDSEPIRARGIIVKNFFRDRKWKSRDNEVNCEYLQAALRQCAMLHKKISTGTLR